MLPSEQAAIVDVIDPDAYGAGAVNGAWVAAKNFHAFMAVALVGDFVVTGLYDLKLQQATDSSGTGAKDITGKAITQLTQAGTDDNKQAVINLLTEELDVEGGFDYIRLVQTLTTAGADAGAMLLGLQPRRAPASAFDKSTVDEIVS